MIGSRAARRYAKAVLLQASDTNTAHVVFEDMQSVSATISNNSELKEMLNSPVFNDEDKKEALHKIFTKQTNSTKSLISTLVANKRASLLNDVASINVRFILNNIVEKWQKLNQLKYQQF